MTLGQCHISIPPENVRKLFLTFLGGIEMSHYTQMV